MFNITGYYIISQLKKKLSDIKSVIKGKFKLEGSCSEGKQNNNQENRLVKFEKNKTKNNNKVMKFKNLRSPQIGKLGTLP